MIRFRKQQLPKTADLEPARAAYKAASKAYDEARAKAAGTGDTALLDAKRKAEKRMFAALERLRKAGDLDAQFFGANL